MSHWVSQGLQWFGTTPDTKSTETEVLKLHDHLRSKPLGDMKLRYPKGCRQTVIVCSYHNTDMLGKLTIQRLNINTPHYWKGLKKWFLILALSRNSEQS